jgi:NAD dependent epimerase/dehydratase family enzyme
MTLPFRFGAGGPLGSGRQWFPWIHVDDLVGLYRLALESELSGPVNAASPGIVRQRELASQVGKVLHRPAVLPTPAPVLRLTLGSAADLLLHGRRAEPRAAEAAGYEFRWPELRPALEDVLR